MTPTPLVKDKVFELVEDFMPDHLKGEIALGAAMMDDLGMDSLDKVEFIIRLEEEFRIEISDDDADEIKTLGELIAHIEMAIK